MWGPCPWTGLWIPLRDSINPALPPPLKIPTMNNNDTIFHTLPLEVGCFSTTSSTTGTAGRGTCGHVPDGGLRCIAWNTRGLVGSFFLADILFTERMSISMLIKKHLRHRDRHGKQVGSMARLLGKYLEPKEPNFSGSELRHHCLSHDPGATLSTQSSSVLILNDWSCRFQVKRSCQASKILSPRAQTSSPRG